MVKHQGRVDEEPRYRVVPISALLSMPFQARLEQEEDIEELAESIRRHGVLEPILARPLPSGLLEVVAGGRRVRAARMAGLIEVPVLEVALSVREAVEVQLAENIHRRDLSDYEKARWMRHMLANFPDVYPTQKALAEKIGKTPGWVTQHLRILELESKQEFTRVNLQQMTERQAREILAAPPEKRRLVARRIRDEGEVPSAREIREMVEPSKPRAARAKREREPGLEERARELGLEVPKAPRIQTAKCPLCGSSAPAEVLALKYEEYRLGEPGLTVVKLMERARRGGA